MSTHTSWQQPRTNNMSENRLFAAAARRPLTGISVFVVGAGVGGIMTALERWRQGHEVRLLERSSGPVEKGQCVYECIFSELAADKNDLGDFFTVGFSAVKSFRNWPQLAKLNEELACDP